MKRIFGSLAVSCMLLSGCGGKLQSPDFDATLRSIDIIFTPVAGSATALTAPGSEFQFTAVGRYSTPPGTKADAQRNVPCTDGSADVCTLGEISGVSWSVDPSTNAAGAIASINASGRATGLRRGNATIRAKLEGFESTEALTVDGPVLTSFTITTTPTAAATGVTSVPTGRSVTLTAVPSCSNLAGTTPCTKDYTTYSWVIPAPFPGDTVTFTPASAAGKSIIAKTKRFGAFSIDASIQNEEKDTVTSTASINATNRVLDDIIVAADPNVAEPVPLLKGARTRFVARGIFSDGSTGEISAADLGGASKSLTWTPDSSSVGQIDAGDIETSPAPNTAVIVTVKPGARLGASGLTASGVNIETTPEPLAIDDRIPVEVRDLGLIAVTNICLLRPFEDVGNTCSSDIQIPATETFTFKAKGTFEGDAAGVERDLDPALIGLTWGKSPASTNITVTPATGEVRGDAQGVATVTVGLNTGVAPTVTDRGELKAITVIDQQCRDQLLLSNGAAATTADSDTTVASSSQVTNAGNVIDAVSSTFGTFTVASSLTGEDLSMIFRRDGRVITPSASGGQNVSFLLQYADPELIPSDLLQFQTLDASGAVVQTFNNVSPQTTVRGAQTFYQYSANATMPFAGLRVNVAVPSFGLGDILTNPANLPTALLALLGVGGSFDVNVYTACANANAN